jgi:tRNA(adenine34) deaminase
MERDEQFMEEAILLAKEAARLGEVPIGCVIVKDDTIVGRGYNRRETGKSALYHAELMAIEEACRTLGGWRLWQCSLYVTLEPCPMCAGAIINARIPQVFYGASDPKAGSVGSVIDLFSLPYNHRPQVVSGVLEAPCAQLLRNFFRELRQRRKSSAQVKETTEMIDKTAFSGYDK